jgi:hypothetical protein
MVELLQVLQLRLATEVTVAVVVLVKLDKLETRAQAEPLAVKAAMEKYH